tara:strand:- start:1726 stop:1896 length:171 start_codon:yes stop_codon:yes gene_type:complete
MKANELNKALDTMDIPPFRKELTTSNVRWLLRNVRVRNSKHPRIADVVSALKRLAK